MSDSFKPTHRHTKSGNLYRVIGSGHDCTNGRPLAPVVIYEDVSGRVWVRYWPEFHDGRFEEIKPLEAAMNEAMDDTELNAALKGPFDTSGYITLTPLHPPPVMRRTQAALAEAQRTAINEAFAAYHKRGGGLQRLWLDCMCAVAIASTEDSE